MYKIYFYFYIISCMNYFIFGSFDPNTKQDEAKLIHNCKTHPNSMATPTVVTSTTTNKQVTENKKHVINHTSPKPLSVEYSKPIVLPPVYELNLKHTNIIRNFYGLPPLKWNSTLEHELKKFTDKCLPYGHFRIDTPSAQNLAGGNPCNDKNKTTLDCEAVPKSATIRWIEKEGKNWDFQKKACKTNNECGHFITIVSPTATHMACSYSSCGANTHLFCNYIDPSRSLDTIKTNHEENIDKLLSLLDETKK